MSAADVRWPPPVVAAVVGVWVLAGVALVRPLGVLVGGGITIWGGSVVVLLLVLRFEERARRVRIASVRPEAALPAGGPQPVAA